MREKPAVQRPSAVQRISRRRHDYRAFRTGCVTVNIKKILTWAGIAFLLFFLISAPAQASEVVNGILASLRQAAEAVITFMQNLFR
ncbi:hypothetical protein DFQ14_10868 [Halopolyspora algeriensis]|uniref:Uncharacterized protein n=1 Tax=Halopolyspora algeriensis TaxID=1500506 RepID=A0A368VPL7_9ACTN|nr:hypothetical protein DFQ14_10868 [Halopolyspora algeriensis]TQM56718.1 hypothetical protein FHU43_1532 [Halopolyspora algeriensis]